MPMLYWISLNIMGCKNTQLKIIFCSPHVPLAGVHGWTWLSMSHMLLVLPTLIKSIRKTHFPFGFISLLTVPLGRWKRFSRHLTGILYVVFCRTLDRVCLCLSVKIFHLELDRIISPPIHMESRLILKN